jgi:UDPglucose--hexose-1-phosphate uridylyltransferase
LIHERALTKPDGRSLTLYSRRPIAGTIAATAPTREPAVAHPHLRWHPLRGEWVAYASYRQDRTFLPPPEYNPLLPSSDPGNPTELPAGDYDMAVFDNLFPVLSMSANGAPGSIVPTQPANGRCEVVVFTQDPSTSLGELPVDHIALLLEVWGRRTQHLAADGTIRYVLPFENRGVEVGVTLHHPHGQIYAYAFVPPVPQRMLENERRHLRETGRVLVEKLIAAEVEAGERIVYANEHAASFVPAWARYPYETWIATHAAVPDFASLSDAQRMDLARALKATLLKYDALWQHAFPYIMAWYQAPTDGERHPESHLHAEIYPAYRARGRLKYLAGTEIAAGVFANDTLPERTARELREIDVAL